MKTKKKIVEDEETMKAKKAEMDSEEEDDGEEEEEEGEMSKASIAASDLVKAMDAYEAVEAAVNEGGTDRESVLTARLREGTITKSEQAELGRMWAGERSSGESMRKSLHDSIEDDDADASDLLDASPFLKSLVDNLDSSLSDIQGNVIRDGNATRSLLKSQGMILKSLAALTVEQEKVIASQGEMIKSLHARVNDVERQPVVRKSQGVDPRDVTNRDLGNLTKSSGAAANSLNKSEILTGLRDLSKAAADANDDSALGRIAHATAMFESTNQIHPQMLAAVRAQLGR